jgi:hypothetical protein
MLSLSLSLAVVMPLTVQALEFLDDNRMVQQPGLIRYPIHPLVGAPAVKNITRRQNDVILDSQQSGYFYTIDLELGTPGQRVTVNLDTGSTELWVNPVCENSNDPEFCASFPRFTESSTFVDLGQEGSVTYGSGYANFEYGYDYVSVGSARVSQQIFGVAYDSEFSSVGILGMGPDLSGWDSIYPFLVDSLAEQGFTNSRAFSLDLRSLDSDRGSLVLGGIDTKKYSGPLEKRPIIPAAESPDGYTRFWVYLDGISIVLPDGSDNEVFSEVNGQPVLLDSGYTISALPGPLFQAIVDLFPTTRPISGSDSYEVDCDVGDLEGSVDFTFGNTVIHVPYADFIWEQPEFGICVLGVFQDDEFPVLGDSFLRAAYAVYDWDNRNVHLANNDDCGSNLVAIGSGPDAVPSLVGECGEATPTKTSSTTSSTTTSSSTKSSSTKSSTTTSSTTESTKTTESSTTKTATDKPPVSTTSTTRITTGWSNSTTTTSTGSASESTFTSTKTYTITSCPPTVTNCPVGSVTTEVVTATTTVCPETTATYTIPKTVTCNKGLPGCDNGSTYTTTYTVTVVPITTQTVPVTIPGCPSCPANPPPGAATSTLTSLVPPVGSPTGSPNATYTTAVPPVPTGGAAGSWQVSGSSVLIAAVAVAAALAI